MIHPPRVLGCALALPAAAIAIAGCGGGGTGNTAQASGQASGSGYAGATVAVRNTKLGKILVGPQGRSLYLFEKDKGTKSACFGACASAWPPLTTSGSPKAGQGVKVSLLGTTRRSDGTREVTYSGHPLYYYAGDQNPGDTNGQGLKQFGAEWSVLSPAGTKAEASGSGGSASGNGSSTSGGVGGY